MPADFSCSTVNLTQPISPNPVSVGQAFVKLALQNKKRLEIIVQNVGATVIYIGCGFIPTTTNYSIALQQSGTAHDGSGGVWVSDVWQGDVYAISQLAGGLVAITEAEAQGN